MFWKYRPSTDACEKLQVLFVLKVQTKKVRKIDIWVLFGWFVCSFHVEEYSPTSTKLISKTIRNTEGNERMIFYVGFIRVIDGVENRISSCLFMCYRKCMCC